MYENYGIFVINKYDLYMEILAYLMLKSNIFSLENLFCDDFWNYYLFRLAILSFIGG